MSFVRNLIELPLSVLIAGGVLLYFLIGMATYVYHNFRHGQFIDEDQSTRSSSKVMTEWIRMYWTWITRPIFWFLDAANVPANAITSLSLMVAIGAGFALSLGHLSLGGGLFIFAGALDFLDGRVARARGEAGPAGAAFDSILDRVADAAVLMGLAWYYRETWVLIPVMSAIVGTLLVSYIRARGEGLGVTVKVGLMQRPERIALLSAALVLSPVLDPLLVTVSAPHTALVAVLVVMAATTLLTAAHRLFVLLALLNDRPKLTQRRWFGKGSVFRALVASVVATGADFVVFSVLVSLDLVTPWFATAIGCVIGGFINFSIGRIWAFNSRGAAGTQASRYVLVSATSAGLNAAGVALLTLGALAPQASWLIVRVMVFLGWNYPLQKNFVFNATARASSPAPALLRSEHPTSLGGPA